MKRPASIIVRALPYYTVGEPIDAMKAVSEKAREMTPDELRMSLVAAGIITEAGQLSTHYSQVPKKKLSTK